MLEMIDIGIDRVVAYRLGGKITEDEMKLALSALKEKIDEFGEVSIYQEIESIGGVEMDALLEKLKFFYKVGFADIKRVAVVTPKSWMPRLVDIEGKLFRNVEMKGFSVEEKNKAVDFLKLGTE